MVGAVATKGGGGHGDSGTSSTQCLKRVLLGLRTELLGMAWEVASFSPEWFCCCDQLYSDLPFPSVL